MTTMNNQALAEYRSSPVVQENFLKSFENISPDFQADVLTKFYKNNTEQFSRLEQCLKKHDASALNQMYQAEKQKISLIFQNSFGKGRLAVYRTARSAEFISKQNRAFGKTDQPPHTF